MSRFSRGSFLVAVSCVIVTAAAWAQDEKVTNPFYRFWAGFKPGSTAVHLEQTKLSGADAQTVPKGIEENRITYKLIEVSPEQVVLEMVVREREFLGYVEAAPTRQIYPAQIRKADLDRIMEQTGAKMGEDTVKFDGRELKCRTMTGNVKGTSGEVVEYKVWLSDEVPGSIVKKVRTTRNGADMIAETTTTLQSYKKAE